MASKKNSELICVKFGIETQTIYQSSLTRTFYPVMQFGLMITLLMVLRGLLQHACVSRFVTVGRKLEKKPKRGVYPAVAWLIKSLAVDF